jgi:hypothetical protein
MERAPRQSIAVNNIKLKRPRGPEYARAAGRGPVVEPVDHREWE